MTNKAALDTAKRIREMDAYSLTEWLATCSIGAIESIANALLTETAAREADRRRIADLEDFLKGAAKQFNAMAAPGASREAASVGEANTTTKELTDG